MNEKINAYLRFLPVAIQPNSKESIPVRGNCVRVISSAVPINFENQDGSIQFTLNQGEQASFDEAIFTSLFLSHASGIAQPVILSVSAGAEIGSAQVSGVVTISGNIQGVTNTVNTVNAGQSYGASYRSVTALAANTADTVFTAAANVNGAILHSAQFATQYAGGLANQALLAKATAPANVTDGDAILSTDVITYTSASNYQANASLKNPLRIPAGKGLFFISSLAENISNRSALFTLL